MKYITFMLITLAHHSHDIAIAFINFEACSLAIDTVPEIAAPLDAEIRMVRCIETSHASTSIRPRPRPEHLTWHDLRR